MIIDILGWYGTETIGDRAILCGLLQIINAVKEDVVIELGSIYPFFTERTLHEDINYIKKTLGKEVDIKLFDSRNHNELKKHILQADCVFVGGGPLMDVSWMYMLEYSLMKAHKSGKITGVLGCGIGPLYKKKYVKSCEHILENCDILIFRDESSRMKAKKICPDRVSEMHAFIDPACVCALHYLEVEKKNTAEYIALNLRELPDEYLVAGQKQQKDIINNHIQSICENFINYGKCIKLVPMHYFGIGGDDRIILNKLKQEYPKGAIEVFNDPLTLEETMNVYMNAELCMGMRFHSVVLQTILNGNNYIIDYTEPQKGKISGFLTSLQASDFYEDRYINLQQGNDKKIEISNEIVPLNANIIRDMEKRYVEILKTHIGCRS